ncbi:hypothetical protein A3D11_01430 [Candidatus Peribacteria bacterium RIFCSPHIGHO2_02_FULL_49_16]|nr:MAG: hypothetical protein A2880_00625 [Candidatus Peribacteria bacterium RIFCSPHIGHO2_01_FULL_49_38]OGJ59689.1 MAG: hypothetical protein A3D11_01430 [Candidatus Peribacteria bacterium RIFCSPHIGHO2_02_FULL_49_16]
MSFLPRASIIVPVHNAEHTIAECIESLLNLDYPKEHLEIIVVENASTDETPAALFRYRNDIRILQEPWKSRSAARNRGLWHATGDVIAFTDADCMVERQWLRRIIAPLHDERIGVVGGKILAKTPCNSIGKWSEHLFDHAAAIHTFHPPYAITANWASRTSVLTERGGFDEAFPRCEDVDLSWRIFQAGYCFLYEPRAVVYHRNKDTVFGLMRLGYLHGLYAVRVRRAHAGFLQKTRHDNPPTLPPRREFYRFLFDAGKKLGEAIGSRHVHRTSIIGILMTCKDQKEQFLREAIESVIHQSSADWLFFIVIDHDTPQKISDIIRSYAHPQIHLLQNKGRGLGGGINTAMHHAETKYVCILLSDDTFALHAIETLQRFIREFPGVDFFHSSRQFIDSRSRIRTPIMESKEFRLEDFKKHGGVVKHLLCWRRRKGIDAGGIDEHLDHGCDDFDFPWKMAEVGCTFKAIRECLYFYRVHHDFRRLTTCVPIKTQVSNIRTIFRKHKVSETETEAYIRSALNGYLLKDRVMDFEQSHGVPECDTTHTLSRCA